MFPIDYQVNVRRGEGPVQRYTLLENQDDKFLVVIHPTAVRELMGYVKRENKNDDGLVALLADEAVVLDRKKGTVLPMDEANRVLAESKHPAISRAAVFRNPMPELPVALTGEDLAWAFGFELAKRRLSA